MIIALFHHQMFHCSIIRCSTLPPSDVLLFHHPCSTVSPSDVSPFHHQMFYCSTVGCSKVPPSVFHCFTISVTLFHHQMVHCSTISFALFHHQMFHWSTTSEGVVIFRGSTTSGSYNQGFLCVHKDIEWNLDEIINIYAREDLRRMKPLDLLGGDGDSKILLMLCAK